MAKGQSELARRRRVQNNPVDYGKRTRSAYRILERLRSAESTEGLLDIAKAAERHLESFTYSEDEK